MNNNFTDLQLYCLDKVAEGQYTFDLSDRKLFNLMPIELKSLIGAEMGLNKNGDPNGYAIFTGLGAFNDIVIVWVDFYEIHDKKRCGYIVYNTYKGLI